MGSTRINDLRRAVWHLRHGGMAQARTFWRRRRLRRHEAHFDAADPMSFDPWVVSKRPPARPTLRVAVILDDFSRAAFEPEWDQVVLTPSGWRDQVEPGIDLPAFGSYP